ncbi:MAG: hypothetical protein J6C85_05170 [Alphaproteobacteria bacterium]|nr:hypothetical protein [Alphaproteobacteria bacterium]
MKKFKLFFCSPELWFFGGIIGISVLLCNLFSHEAPVSLGVSDWMEVTVVGRTEIPAMYLSGVKTTGIKLKLSNRQEIIVSDFGKVPELLFLKQKNIGDTICYRKNPQKPLGKEFCRQP